MTKEAKLQESMMLEYSVPIMEAVEVDGDFMINGIAINETTTSNGHTFIGEELAKSAVTLINVPLLKDHNNTVDSIVGRVKAAHFDQDLRNIQFKARVIDRSMKQKIKDGLVNSVSVGAHVNPEDIEEGENGDVIPHNITFKELSLVAVPADAGATFQVALNNAYNGLKSHSNEKLDNIERGSNIMTQEEENAVQPEEEKAEAPEVKEEKSEEAEEAKEEPKAEEPVNEKILSLLSDMDKRMAKLESADEDEAKPEEPAEEPKEEPKEEAEEEAEEEEDKVEESAGYSIAEGHKSFTVVRKDYSQRLTV